MGRDFQMSMGFISDALKKWLPRMRAIQRENIAGAIYDVLDGLRRNGKNENMLKMRILNLCAGFIINLRVSWSR